MASVALPMSSVTSGEAFLIPTLLFDVSTFNVFVLTVRSLATSNPVPFKSFRSVEVNLAPMLLLPALRNANSINPSSVPSLASSILAVTFA